MALSPPRVFLTGGAGFVGRSIIWRIQQVHPDWMIFSFDKDHIDLRRKYNPSFDISKVTWLTGDILDISAVETAFTESNPTIVIHTAGIVPALAYRYNRRQERTVYNVNIAGTKVILQASRAFPSIRAFVWTGSVCAVIDDTRYQYPCIDETWRTSRTNSTVYGESKAIAEKLVLQSNDPDPSDRNGIPFFTTALRPSTLFGPEDYQLVPSIHACIAKNELPYIVGDGSNLWDVTDVRNVAHAHVLAVENLISTKPTAAGEAILFGNGCPITFRDFCLYIWSHWDVYPRWQIYVPLGLAIIIAGIIDWFSWIFGLRTTLSAGSVYDAVAVRYVDGRKAEDILGYVPIIGLEEGLHESCLAYKERLLIRHMDTEVVAKNPLA